MTYDQEEAGHMRVVEGTGLEGDNSPGSTGKCEKNVKVGNL